MKKLLYEHRL